MEPQFCLCSKFVESQFGEHMASASGTDCDGAPRVLTMVPSPPPTTIDKAVPVEPVARATEPKASRNSVARLIPYARIVVALALVAGLRWGQAVWIPLVLSVLISYALEPIVAFMAAHHLPRAAAVPTLLCALLVVGGGGAYALRGEATAFVNRLPVAAHTVAQSIQNLTRGTPDRRESAGGGTGARISREHGRPRKPARTASRRYASRSRRSSGRIGCGRDRTVPSSSRARCSPCCAWCITFLPQAICTGGNSCASSPPCRARRSQWKSSPKSTGKSSGS